MSALVSIIMPACNAAATIAAAAASLAAQSHREWELLVVSDDGCDYARVLGDAGISDARIRFLAEKGPARGPAAARNLGQRRAEGELVTRLDADDLYEPDRLRLMVPLALRHGVAGDNAAAYDEGHGGVLGTVLPISEGIVPVALFELVLSPIPWCLLFRRDLLPEWDEDLRFAEDVVFNARAFEHVDRVPVLGRALWRYRVMASSLSHAKGAAALADATYAELIAECERGRPRLRKPELAPAWRRALEAKRALNRAFMAAYAQGETRSFQEFALKRNSRAAS